MGQNRIMAYENAAHRKLVQYFGFGDTEFMNLKRECPTPLACIRLSPALVAGHVDHGTHVAGTLAGELAALRSRGPS